LYILAQLRRLGIFSDRISHCSQQFKVSNLIFKLFQQEHLWKYEFSNWLSFLWRT